MAASLDTDLLTAFIAVAETESFTKAAQQLHRTQSTISLQIKRLEDIVGAPLFVRTTRSLAPTQSGEMFLVYAKRILQLQLEALAASSGGLRVPIVRLGLPEDYAAAVLPGLLRALREHEPRIELHIYCAMSEELVSRLHEGELDLTLGIRCQSYSEGRIICEEPVVWSAHHAFAIEAVQSVPLAVWPPGCPFRARALNALAEIGRPSRVVYTSQNPTGIEIAVREGLGVTVRSRRTLPGDWRVLAPEDGFPALLPVELEFHRSPTALHHAHDMVEKLLETQLLASGKGVLKAAE
jgi:DNA-binding transcriptional LysR family regulator